MINKNEKRRRTFKPVPISDKLKDINKNYYTNLDSLIMLFMQNGEIL